ncbi:MAG: hypothetical protein O9322_04300 [Beijerinckiaceae bacterium]|nr:hypothetical protein [Beijerinckiaceae bacterium]MCZ8298741.1 hypothetical protein [Beijerinckiaceae bacterium]
MFKPFAAASAVPVAARQIKVASPAGHKAIVLQVSPGDTLDLSAVVDRKITVVRLDHRLILLFEDKGHIVIEGALTPDGLPVDGILTSPAEGKVLPLADLLASMGPLHTAEILTQAGITPPVISSALAAVPPAIDYDPGNRPGLDLLGNEEFGSSLPLPEKKIGALDEKMPVDSPVIIDLDTRDGTTNDYFGYFEIEAAGSDAFASPSSGVEIVQVSSADGVAHLSITDPDGGPMPVRLVIELGDTRMGDPGFLQVDPAVLAQFGASVTGDGTGRIVLETGQPLSAGAMTTLLAAIRYFNTEATFLMDNADREITVTAIHEKGQISTSTAFIPVIAYVEDSTNIDVFVGTRFSDIIFGLDGDNVIDGGAGHDWIETGDGNNRVDGGRGRDFIVTGSGDDRIDGGEGSDTLYAGAGADQVSGGRGNDEIDGEDGDDAIDGGDGDDTINGGDGRDNVAGGAGDDSVDGWTGDDVVSGGDGDDSVFGDDGDDIVRGDAGNDWIMGEAGDDMLEGGSGDDFLIGGTGDDRIEGGDGNDAILVRIEDGFDSHIDGGAGTDTLAIASDDPQTWFSVTLDGDQIREITLSSANYFTDAILTDAQGNRNVQGVEHFHLEQFGWPDGTLDFSTTMTAISVDLDVRFERMVVLGEATGFSAIAGFRDVIGGSGDDTLVGDQQDNEIAGNSGNDRIDGDGGDDRLSGGRGNDEILGGDGNDSITGGRGDDRIDGGDGNDFIRSNITDGFDSHIDGGAGFDSMLIESNSPGTRFAITLDGTAIRSLSQFSPNVSRDAIVTDAQGKSNVTGIESFELIQWFPMDGTLDFSATQTSIYVDLDWQGRGNGTTGFATGFAEVYGFQHVIGGAGNDTLSGDVNRNEFDGGTGDDRLYTGDGDDMVIGGAGNDRIRGAVGNDDVDGGDGNDLILHVIGDGFDSRISGGAGNDVMRIETDLNSTYATIQFDANGVLTGLTLDANGVSEQVIAADAQGNLNVEGVEAFALHHLGAADGTLDFSGVTTGVNVDLDGPAFGNGKGTATGFSEVVGFRHVIGGDGDDSLWGDDRGNTIEGAAGNDYIVGFGGDDVIVGGDGDDRLFGMEGTDRIYGGAGNDLLAGYKGDDMLDGGDGDDRLVVQFGHNTLTGGSGADQFRITLSLIELDPAANGNHVVTDFNAAEGDQICFYSNGFPDSMGIAGALSGQIDPNRFVSGTDFTRSDQRFLFNTQDNTLYYDADGSGAASDKMAVCTLLQGTLDASLIQLIAP